MGFMISVLNAYYWSNKYVFKEQEDAPRWVWWKVLLKSYAAYAQKVRGDDGQDFEKEKI
ncbi:MAG: hypothetical protein J1E65_05555 [Lachnospiraceae bacterium]|nr:hypothetical protein [Lachnospiraceae bacterium]